MTLGKMTDTIKVMNPQDFGNDAVYIWIRIPDHFWLKLCVDGGLGSLSTRHSLVLNLCEMFLITFNVEAVCVAGKTVVSMPVGGPAMMNNYMIAQPPGFQLAAFVSDAL